MTYTDMNLRLWYVSKFRWTTGGIPKKRNTVYQLNLKLEALATTRWLRGQPGFNYIFPFGEPTTIVRRSCFQKKSVMPSMAASTWKGEAMEPARNALLTDLLRLKRKNEIKLLRDDPTVKQKFLMMDRMTVSLLRYLSCNSATSPCTASNNWPTRVSPVVDAASSVFQLYSLGL